MSKLLAMDAVGCSQISEVIRGKWVHHVALVVGDVDCGVTIIREVVHAFDLQQAMD